MSDEPVPIAVFASGRGTNFVAIAEAVRAGRLSARITTLISDRADAKAVAIAEALGIPRHVIVPDRPRPGSAPSERRARHEEKVLKALEPDFPRFLVMAGYMRVISPLLIERFRSPEKPHYARIINVHPALLPAFQGLSGYARAFDHGVKVTGATVHLVESEVDSGPICAQEAFSIGDCGSAQEVEARGLAIENRLYPETLRWVLPEGFDLVHASEGRFRVRPH